MSKDLDYIISTEHPDEVQQQLLNIPNKVKDVVVGQTKVSLELTYDDETIGVDFRLIEPVAFYHTLQHFTGSKDHNIRIRQMAKAQNEKIRNMELNNKMVRYYSYRVRKRFINISVRNGLHPLYVKTVANLIKI